MCVCRVYAGLELELRSVQAGAAGLDMVLFKSFACASTRRQRTEGWFRVDWVGLGWFRVVQGGSAGSRCFEWSYGVRTGLG